MASTGRQLGAGPGAVSRWTASGRVGPRIASLVARHVAHDLVSVTCANNPTFWLMIDTDTATAGGCVKGCHLPVTATFSVRSTGDGLRVDHAKLPWFWLDLRPVPTTRPDA